MHNLSTVTRIHSISLHYDEHLCLACHACEVACKVEHELPVGVNRILIRVAGPVLAGDHLRLDFECRRCRQCPDAPCVAACPTDSLSQSDAGLILVDDSLCTGCRSCLSACPFDAISFMPDTGVAEVCDLCFDRLTEGRRPSCVRHCMTGALSFGPTEG